MKGLVLALQASVYSIYYIEAVQPACYSMQLQVVAKMAAKDHLLHAGQERG